MGHNKILNIFLENPTKELQIRKISRELNIPKSSVSYNINKLLKDNIIIKKKGSVFPYFIANTDCEMHRFIKKQEALKKIIESGVIDYIERETNPRCMILFGSFAKAEYDSESDIDLFVQSKDKSLKLAKFERKLKHSLNILFEPDLKKLSSELFNNIINGVKLRGFIKINHERNNGLEQLPERTSQKSRVRSRKNKVNIKNV